jgi:hypothetical protein
MNMQIIEYILKPDNKCPIYKWLKLFFRLKIPAFGLTIDADKSDIPRPA